MRARSAKLSKESKAESVSKEGNATETTWPCIDVDADNLAVNRLTRVEVDHVSHFLAITLDDPIVSVKW
jgi:hypothetical protein